MWYPINLLKQGIQMAQALTKNNIRKKTIETGSFTLLSRGFGLIRELLLTRYLGISDIFWVAYRIPSFFRKIFAEGALSTAFVPSIVHSMRYKTKREVNALMALSFIIFEGLLLIMSLCFLIFAKPLLTFLAPGFSVEQIEQAIPMLILLMPFIFFLCACALFAGALQAINHFFIPALSPIVLNLVLIGGILINMTYNFPIASFCYWIVIGGFVQFCIHAIMYMRLQLGFNNPTKQTLKDIVPILIKFIACVPGLAMSEVSLFIDTSFASYIPGAISNLRYANSFMGIPLGVFAAAFSTILLPHFSRINNYAPKRLSFYLLETTKLIVWIMLPITIGMAFFSHQIFYTLFVSEKFSIEQATMAGNILIASITGLLFFSLNKILINLYYACHNTIIPTVVSIISMSANIGLNYLLMPLMGAPGLALGTSIAAAIQTALSLFFLRWYLNFTFYGKAFNNFLYYYSMQVASVGGVTLIVYYLFLFTIDKFPPAFAYFFLHSIGFWLWVGPLCIGVFLMLFYTRALFKIKLYFLD